MIKLKKLMAVVAATVMAVSAMTISVGAIVSQNNNIASTQSNTRYWIVYIDERPDSITGLVQGKDSGVTFQCKDYSDPIHNGYYVRCTVTNSLLCLYQGDGVNLSYIGDSGTVLFQNDWYRYSNGGTAPYLLKPVYAIEGSRQYMYGCTM